MNPQSEPLKLCTGMYGCGQWLPRAAFPRNRANADGRQAPCRECQRRRYRSDSPHRQAILANQQRAYADDPTKFRRRAWAGALKIKYGLTAEQWHVMLVAQAGRCAICEDAMKRPCVDHCHATRQTRALLCSGCNTRVGAMESPLLEASLRYIESFRDTPRNHD